MSALATFSRPGVLLSQSRLLLVCKAEGSAVQCSGAQVSWLVNLFATDLAG